jgi:glucose-6-phosphate dehydrogenase assembly protein OpcA
VSPTAEEEVWSAQDTTPSAIEGAMRALLAKRHQETGAVSPARVLNMIVICDREYRGEIENRLQKVGRYHPSRAIVCAVQPNRKTLDAWVSMAAVHEGPLTVSRERVEIDVGPHHLRKLQTILAPLVVPDLVTLVWAPHGHGEAEDALREMAQVVLVDSLDDDCAASLARVASLLENMYAVDLAWLRSTPWRERVAAAFDPPYARRELFNLDAVTVRHREDSVAAAALFAGWLASRLNWKPSQLAGHGGTLAGRVKTRRGEVKITLEPVRADVPGLAGVTIGSADGGSVALDRSPGGLREVRTGRDGSEQSFTVMGASRGEGGILGEGVRQALLRDRTYKPALAAARELIG